MHYNYKKVSKFNTNFVYRIGSSSFCVILKDESSEKKIVPVKHASLLHSME